MRQRQGLKHCRFEIQCVAANVLALLKSASRAVAQRRSEAPAGLDHQNSKAPIHTSTSTTTKNGEWSTLGSALNLAADAKSALLGWYTRLLVIEWLASDSNTVGP
jgi:hypothetical protein